jgi:hypothetical protein
MPAGRRSSRLGELRDVMLCTLVVAAVALCMVHRSAPIELAYGWGVNGVADMARHVHAGGWNLDSDQAEQDTGYLHMFSSVMFCLHRACRCHFQKP